MLRRVLSGPLLVIALMPVAACLDPLFEESQVAAGEPSICCVESALHLYVHTAVAGERSSGSVFPGCACFEGPRCSPLYKVAADNACYPLGAFADAGVGYPDAGGSNGGGAGGGGGFSVDAGTTTGGGAGGGGGSFDAGTPPVDAGSVFDAGSAYDAGSPTGGGAGGGGGSVATEWVTCCISSNVTTCLCPVQGPCASANFTLCGGLTCTSTGVCAKH